MRNITISSQVTSRMIHQNGIASFSSNHGSRNATPLMGGGPVSVNLKVSATAPLPPPPSKDSHRFQPPQPRSRERIGELVHLHGCKTGQVASRIPDARAASGTAPTDASRVRA